MSTADPSQSAADLAMIPAALETSAAGHHQEAAAPSIMVEEVDVPHPITYPSVLGFEGERGASQMEGVASPLGGADGGETKSRVVFQG